MSGGHNSAFIDDSGEINPLYKNYNEWILDYDREHINKVLKNGGLNKTL